MPVASQVGFVIGDHDYMKSARRDAEFTAGAEVFLDRCVGLDWRDRYPEKIAHKTRPIAEPIAATTITMSMADRSCSRKGLKPMWER